MSQRPGDQPHSTDQSFGFGTPPGGGPDFVASDHPGPDFGQPDHPGHPSQCGQPAPADQAPQLDPAAYPQAQQDRYAHQGPIQPTIQPAGGGSTRPWIILAVLIVVLGLIAAGLYFGRGLIGGGDPPTNPGQGQLPETPPIEGPAVIDEVADTAGLTCHDEAVNPRKIKGCYLQEENHLVSIRYLISDQAEIIQVNAQVLLNKSEPAERSEELHGLLDPVIAVLPIAEDEQEAIREWVASDDDQVTEEIGWDGGRGMFNLRVSRDVSNVSIGQRQLDFVPQVPLVDDHELLVDELTARDWTCEVDNSILDCEATGLGKLTGLVSSAGLPNGEQRLTRLQIWNDGREPIPDEQRMVDIYSALAATGDRGDVLAVGLRLLAEGEKHFFNSDVEFYRGDSYLELSGVQFA